MEKIGRAKWEETKRARIVFNRYKGKAEERRGKS